jgi:hypothetical protein
MFHVKRFGTIEAENFTKPHTASRFSRCMNAPKTGASGGNDDYQVPLEIAAEWINVKPGFTALCERPLTALTKGPHALTLKASDQKTLAEEPSSRVMCELAPKAQPPRKRSGPRTARG